MSIGFSGKTSEALLLKDKKMKAVWISMFVVSVVLVVPKAWAQSGGDYDLSWSTIDGGGVTFSSGGDYVLGGTAGQCDAGEMQGGDYSLKGGFWVPICGIVYVTGDFDKTCCVNWSDFGIFASHWLETPCSAPDWCGGADLNTDGTVNWGDFGIFAAHWLECN